MREEKLILEGWKSKGLGKEDYLQCPYCNYYSWSFSLKDEKNAHCYSCDKIFPESELKHITKKVTVAVCKVCEEGVALTKTNLDMIGQFNYLCFKCHNVVAVKFGSDTLQPATVFDLSWNEEIKNQAIKLEDNTCFSVCKSKKDFLILMIMQLMAKKEGTSFLYVRKKEHKSGIIFDTGANKYIGFLVWSEAQKATLRQIYVMEDIRKKGYGTKILKFWVENISDKINEKFVVESPNKISDKMLINLGYARIEGNDLMGVKCLFTRGL